MSDLLFAVAFVLSLTTSFVGGIIIGAWLNRQPQQPDVLPPGWDRRIRKL